jgi:hypothetical protein
VLNNVPFDLGRLPALRHLKIQRRSPYKDSLAPLRFLARLLSLSSSSNGIEILELGITWHSIKVEYGRGKNLFPSDAGWSTLDQLLTSQTYVSLRKIILRLDIEFSRSKRSRRKRNGSRPQHILESERNRTLLCVNDLFPLFRADAQRTLESYLTFTL